MFRGVRGRDEEVKPTFVQPRLIVPTTVLETNPELMSQSEVSHFHDAGPVLAGESFRVNGTPAGGNRHTPLNLWGR